MPKQLIKKICARTHVKLDEENHVNQGSGVIVKDDDDFYLLTADHCVYGDGNQYKDISCENIIVEVQDAGFDSPFRRVKVMKIIDSNKDDDWVLLQIENPNIDCDYLRFYKGYNFIEEVASFIGYQNMNKDQFRSFDVDLIDVSEKSFKITLKDKTFSLPGEDGSSVAKGLSGSGVFIMRGSRLYLIGHLKSVIGDVALNDDIICCHVKKLEDLFKNKCTDLSDLQEIATWNEEVETSAIEKDIEEWKKQKVVEFDNILRKQRILYPDEKAQRITCVDFPFLVRFKSIKNTVISNLMFLTVDELSVAKA